MIDLQKLVNKTIKFRDQRDWKQFHNPKDIALSMVLEAGEVLEHFQWKNGHDLATHLEKNKDELSKELMDTLAYLLILTHDLDIDIEKSFDKKLMEDTKKYPISKSKGKSTKYTKL
ncbi:MAG TPA: nucleotide pyrophosphohydrolase [Patescibacteria group bacterium]|nr:nucleotide pyrophosphohydrolase [Patescibacteria group bacterium]